MGLIFLDASQEWGYVFVLLSKKMQYFRLRLYDSDLNALSSNADL